MSTIRANSILPAERTSITLITADSLKIVAELASPRDPEATIICVHPLPTQGGSMDSHVLRKMSWRLPALSNIAVLRFNTRGTTSDAGTSEGLFDKAQGEGLDLQTVISHAVGAGLPDIWVIGWSFGTDVILKNLVDPAVKGVILLSPPLRFTSEAELEQWSGRDTPVIALIPELDDFMPPEYARMRFASAQGISVEAVPGAKHLWVGEKYVYFVLNRVTELITPDHAPLPTEWSGPMLHWSDL